LLCFINSLSDDVKLTHLLTLYSETLHQKQSVLRPPDVWASEASN